MLAIVCSVAPAGQAQNSARNAAEKRRLAEGYYHQALEMRQALEQIPFEQRVAGDYRRVIQAFRRVYWTTPAYGNNTLSLMAIGELYQEMGQRWQKGQKENPFESAIKTYEFLLREYPRSQFRREARLAIARIYRDGLERPEDALKQFERFVANYPRVPEAEDARRAVAELRSELAAKEAPEKGKEKEPEVASAAAGQPAAPEPPAPAASNLALVSGVRHWVTPDYTRVVIDVGKDVKYGAGRVGNPPRVYIDLFESRPAAEINNKTFPVEDGLLKGVKAGRHRVDVTRVVLYVADPTEYSIFELPNPHRVVVDIRDRPVAEAAAASRTPGPTPAVPAPPAASGPAPKEPARPAAPSEAARARLRNPTSPPEAAEPAKPAEVAQAVSGEAATPTVPATKEPARPAAPSKAARARLRSPAPPPEAAEPAKPAEVAKTASGPVFEKVEAARPNRDGTRSLTRALGLKIGRILLDPGHGGADVGTIGPAGLHEKDLVLDIAKRLGQLISERLGSEVLYTRQEDVFVPLETRPALANEQQADLFLSIHANSSRNPRASGVETYYLNFTTDAEALAVAARENAVSQERISQLQGLVRKIALAEKVDESKEFATHVQSSVSKAQPARSRRGADRGVKKAPFVVLIGANMPSVLAEVAFLSNPQEEKLLNTPEHRQKIAEALYSGIVAYVETLSVVKVAGRQTELAAPAK